MDRNSLKARAVRISAWTAGGLSLPAIGLIVAGAGAKGDVGLHLTVWGIQLMLVVTALAFTMLVLRVGLRRIILWIGLGIKKMWAFKGGKATASHAALAMLADENDEEQSVKIVTSGGSHRSYEETPVWSVGSHLSAHYNWDTDEIDPARSPAGLYNPSYKLGRKHP